VGELAKVAAACAKEEDGMRATKKERAEWASLWKLLYDRLPTISEDAAKHAAAVALEWMSTPRRKTGSPPI
jgi:hypothetical protein